MRRCDGAKVRSVTLRRRMRRSAAISSCASLARCHQPGDRLHARRGERQVSLVVTNGTVVTMDGAGRVIAERRRGDRRLRHRRRRHGRRDSAPVPRRRDDRRRRAGGAARADQHPHARADGAVPRAGRRPGADGVADEVHLSRRKPRPSRRSSCAPARGWPRSR